MQMQSNRSYDDFYRSVFNKEASALNAPTKLVSGEYEIPERIMDAASMKIYGPVCPANTPATLTWRNLNVITKITRAVKTQKVLLNNLSGTIAGGLYAIMGASGSGKTTLQCVLAQRLDTTNMTISGDMLLNGHEYTKAELKSMSGFVMQDDLLSAPLTVEETLWYTAVLRLPQTCTEEDRKQRIDEVLQQLGIGYTRHTCIGDTRRKGISGGERKRVCVAMELLMRPKLLFLDEPTSGLDSTTSLSLITTLKTMTQRGDVTVLATIHQPQTKIFDLFDNLILMKKGNIVYQGNIQNAEAYFAEAGYPAPPKCNPADHLLDVLNLGTTDPSVEQAKVPKMIIPLVMDAGSDRPAFPLRDSQPWFNQFYYLCHRNLKEKTRQYDVFVMNIVVAIIISIFIGFSGWHRMGKQGNSVPLRNGLFIFIILHQGVVAALQGTFSFPLERSLMLRERAAGTYMVSAYFCAKFIIEQIFQTLPPIIFAIMVYPLVQLQEDWNKFFIFASFMVLTSAACTSMANMFACVCGKIDLASVSLVFAMEISRLYSAFYVPPADLTLAKYQGWKILDGMSYVRYAYLGIAINEYEGLKLYCVPGDRAAAFVDTAKTICRFTTGEQVMRVFGYQMFKVPDMAGYLLLHMFVTRFISYLGLRYYKG